VQWNFEKYLVNRHGAIVERIENGTYPDDPTVIAAIEAELAKK
jgi:glutathione peroxidase